MIPPYAPARTTSVFMNTLHGISIVTPSMYVAHFEFDARPNGCRATSEYSTRYLRRTYCKDPARRSRYAVSPVCCPAFETGDWAAAAQRRIHRSPHQIG